MTSIYMEELFGNLLKENFSDSLICQQKESGGPHVETLL
ncbi:hypothetical protein RV11_GL001359 [Enterococcus phoeniculicola]|nr:hypothetical protein RV11_GL001359 [Enterococcus phoeniculicola]